ncbi:MAG: oxygen-independent coproporphyrinogen III oxidase [Gammaproteobacteria bacterium]|nr:MAG: oxygen-independent coproporphyrinogen III oxidase [Gammaproteobacteria bacterium]
MALTQTSNAQDFPWHPELIAKYDKAGPRYTSYPTALQFSEATGEQAYRSAIAGLRNSIAPLSLYVHLPFCKDICYYCACNKIVTKQRTPLRHYLDCLNQEIAMQGKLFGQRRTIMQLHWGGGTPNYLNHAEMTELMHNLATHFKLTDSPQREYSIEIDPRSCETGTLALLKGLGFNRLSMGIQDFDPAVQQAINRLQPYSMVETLVHAARRFNFHSISFDLIYGLPEQSVSTMADTVDKVLALSPERISLYNYAHMPDRFPTQRSIDRRRLPTPEEKLAMFHHVAQTLVAQGYRFIGMDHFVKESDDLALAQRSGYLQRNFQGYSTCKAPDLVGLGVSSIGTVGNLYAQNLKTVDAYQSAIEQGHLPIERGVMMNREDLLRRDVIMALACQMRLDIPSIEAAHGIDFHAHFRDELASLADMANDGLVVLTPQSIDVTESGRVLVRAICAIFDEYLTKEVGKRIHSRII